MKKRINYSETITLLFLCFVWFFLLNFYLVDSVVAKNINHPIETDFDITENNTNINIENDGSDSTYSIEAFEKNAFVYLHQNMKKNLAKYDGIELNIVNYSEEEITLKLHLQNSAGEAVSCKDDSIVIFESQNKYIANKIQDNYIVIPKNFSGKLLVPFTSLSNDKTDEYMKNLKNIISLGITLETKYGLEQKIKFDSLSAYTHDQTKMFFEANDIAVVGQTSINVPKVGENIVKYQVTGNIQPVSFQLLSDDDKMFVSNNGRLVVTNKVESKDAILRIRLNDILSLDIDLEFELENTDSYINIDGEIVNITTPEEIIMKKTSLFYLNIRNNINLIRLLLVIMTIAICCLYYYWNHLSSKKKEDS